MQGALIEPLAIAWHTANRCQVQAGQTVAIHGAGPIGVGVFLTLRRAASRPSSSIPRRCGARCSPRLGARTLLDPAGCDAVAAIRDLTGGHGAHASVDAAGVPASFQAMLHGTRIDGTAVVVAIHHQPVVIPPFDLLMPEVRLTGVAMSVNAFPSVIEAGGPRQLSAGRLGRDHPVRAADRARPRAPARPAGHENPGAIELRHGVRGAGV